MKGSWFPFQGKKCLTNLLERAKTGELNSGGTLGRRRHSVTGQDEKTLGGHGGAYPKGHQTNKTWKNNPGSNRWTFGMSKCPNVQRLGKRYGRHHRVILVSFPWQGRREALKSVLLEHILTSTLCKWLTGQPPHPGNAQGTELTKGLGPFGPCAVWCLSRETASGLLHRCSSLQRLASASKRSQPKPWLTVS